MFEKDINNLKENNLIEIKKSKGGLPNSLWESYSAFANTNGSIFAFTDMENMDTSLKNQLFDLGYKVIRYHMDNKHHYFIITFTII